MNKHHKIIISLLATLAVTPLILYPAIVILVGKPLSLCDQIKLTPTHAALNPCTDKQKQTYLCINASKDNTLQWHTCSKLTSNFNVFSFGPSKQAIVFYYTLLYLPFFVALPALFFFGSHYLHKKIYYKSKPQE